MRLRGIRSIAEVNEFLKEYLPIYNRRFTEKAAQRENLHRPIPKGLNLHRILCIKTERTVRNDFTIAHERKLYQIEDAVKTKKLMVEEYTNGSMAIWCWQQKVKFRQIVLRPDKPKNNQPYRQGRQRLRHSKIIPGEAFALYAKD